MKLNRRGQSPNEPKRQGTFPTLPRPAKYAWGIGMTALVASSLLIDKSSGWMPLVNQAIDLLQQQTTPSAEQTRPSVNR